MNTRIKYVRKEVGLTQSEFGDRIGVKHNSVAQFEAGSRNPSEQTIKMICREFHVSEEWLRTGKGEAFATQPTRERLSEFFGEVLADEDDSFRVRFINALASYTDDDWKILERLLDKIQPPKKEKEEE